MSFFVFNLDNWNKFRTVIEPTAYKIILKKDTKKLGLFREIAYLYIVREKVVLVLRD
jgi:hypothetical protein